MKKIIKKVITFILSVLSLLSVLFALIAVLTVQSIIICYLLTKRNMLLYNKNQIITQPILKDIDGTYSDIDTTMNIELQE